MVAKKASTDTPQSIGPTSSGTNFKLGSGDSIQVSILLFTFLTSRFFASMAQEAITDAYETAGQEMAEIQEPRARSDLSVSAVNVFG